MSSLYLVVKKTFSKTFHLFLKLKQNKNYKLVSNFNKFKTNPLIWEFMSIIFYWNKYCLKLLDLSNDFINDYNFNDKRIKMERKYFLDYDNIELIERKYHKILNKLIDLLFKNNLTFLEGKIILNGLNYNDSINERIIFTFFVLNVKIRKVIINKNVNYLNNIIFINIPEGEFKKGNNSNLCFDNEYPEHVVKIKKFSISKYCITNGQYLDFVNHNGYKNKLYWDPEGWDYIKQKKISNPMFWKNIDNKWYENFFGENKKLRLNNPVKNITYYEARAYCKYNNCRLPNESEWEYLVNNFNDSILEGANLNDTIGSTISVLDDKNVNEFGVVGLFGNVWEWCNDRFYPYDGFKIDKIDKERSLTNFGNKINCRGGSFCTSSEVLTKSYRGCEDPFNLSKFIGFRVVKFK